MKKIFFGLFNEPIRTRVELWIYALSLIISLKFLYDVSFAPFFILGVLMMGIFLVSWKDLLATRILRVLLMVSLVPQYLVLTFLYRIIPHKEIFTVVLALVMNIYLILYHPLLFFLVLFVELMSLLTYTTDKKHDKKITERNKELERLKKEIFNELRKNK